MLRTILNTVTLESASRVLFTSTDENETADAIMALFDVRAAKFFGVVLLLVMLSPSTLMVINVSRWEFV